MLFYALVGALVIAYITSWTAVTTVPRTMRGGGCAPIALAESRIGDRTTPRATCHEDNRFIACSMNMTL